MSRWRCCTAAQCVLAEANGQAFASGQWTPTGEFSGQSLSSWYLELTFTEDMVPQATLELAISDVNGEAPFHLELASQLGYLFFNMNDVPLGYRRPPWTCRRVLIGVENYLVTGSNTREIAIGACIYDADDRLIDAMVWPLDSMVQLPLVFETARTSIPASYIARARLGRLLADDARCCPTLPRPCTIADAIPGNLSYVMPHGTLARPIETIYEDFELHEISGAEISIELCTDACMDMDGFYRIVVQPADGIARLRWAQCGHTAYETDVVTARFIPPEPDADDVYRFSVCIAYRVLGSRPAILCRVGTSTAALILDNVPFTHIINCLRSATFCEAHFQSTPRDMLDRLQRCVPITVSHTAYGTLNRQRIGCTCDTPSYPPGAVYCHGYTAQEVPPDKIDGQITINSLPDLHRPADADNGLVFYPLSLGCHSYPVRGVWTPFCWLGSPDPGVEFANAFPHRNPAGNWDITGILELCEVAHGVICDYYPAEDPHFWDAFYLTYDPARVLEYAIYTATKYTLASRPNEIIEADIEGMTYLCLRLRAASESPDMRIWYLKPAPFPLLRPNHEQRLPPVSSRSFCFSALDMAGLTFSIAGPGPDAVAYILDMLYQYGDITFTVNYKP